MRYKNFIACVVDRETKETLIIERYLPTKKEFRQLLAGNGYSVKFIATEETYDDECVKYWERKQRNRIRQQVKRESAKQMGMTVREYNDWLK